MPPQNRVLQGFPAWARGVPVLSPRRSVDSAVPRSRSCCGPELWGILEAWDAYLGPSVLCWPKAGLVPHLLNPCICMAKASRGEGMFQSRGIHLPCVDSLFAFE